MAVPPSYELTELEGSSVHEILVDNTGHVDVNDDVMKSPTQSAENAQLNSPSSPATATHSSTPSATANSGVGASVGGSSSGTASDSGSPVHLVNSKKIEDVSKKPVVKLMTLEERGEGAVGWSVYKGYIQAANKPLLLAGLLLSFVLGKERRERRRKG